MCLKTHPAKTLFSKCGHTTLDPPEVRIDPCEKVVRTGGPQCDPPREAFFGTSRKPQMCPSCRAVSGTTDRDYLQRTDSAAGRLDTAAAERGSKGCHKSRFCRSRCARESSIRAVREMKQRWSMTCVTERRIMKSGGERDEAEMERDVCD